MKAGVQVLHTHIDGVVSSGKGLLLPNVPNSLFLSLAKQRGGGRKEPQLQARPW